VLGGLRPHMLYAQSQHERVSAGTVDELAAWLAKGHTVDATDDKGATVLHWAAIKGRAEIVRDLVKRGANLNARDNNWATPLHIAADLGHVQIVTHLCERGAQTSPQERPFGATPLHYAAAKGNTAVLEVLAKHGAKVDMRDASGHTPLHWASMAGMVDAVKFLVSLGADVWAQDDTQKVPRQYAGAPQVSEFLRETEEKTNQAFEDAKKVIRATESGDTDVLRGLLAAGASTEATDKRYGYTALMLAAYRRNQGVVRLLIEKGADVNAAAPDGHNALIAASNGGRDKIMGLLLEAKARVESSNTNGITPLMAACLNGHRKAASMLIAKGADVNARSVHGDTALMIAAFQGHVEIARLLVQSGAKINDQNGQGHTALFGAAYGNQPGTVGLLLELGADPNVKSKDGETPLGVASAKGHAKIVELLQTHRPTPAKGSLLVALTTVQLRSAAEIGIEGKGTEDRKAAIVELSFENKTKDKKVLAWEDRVPCLKAAKGDPVVCRAILVPNWLPMAGGVGEHATEIGLTKKDIDDTFKVVQDVFCSWVRLKDPKSESGDHVAVPVAKLGIHIPPGKSVSAKMLFLVPKDLAKGKLAVPGCEPEDLAVDLSQ